MNVNEIKQLYQKDMEFLSSMSTKEYYLYKKWEEINELEYTDEVKNTIWTIGNNLYLHNDFDDYSNIDPIIIPVETKQHQLIWRMLRIHLSSLVYNQLPGRNCRFYVIDRKTQKYLGIFALSSDFMDVGDRNRYIGWSKEQYLGKGMLRHTAIGSTIVPTQPFGYNFIGGKLMGLLIVSNVVEEYWNNKYDEILAGITTTSIYGGKSQYNSLPYWRKCKTSQGSGMLMPSNYVYRKLQDYLRWKYPDKFTGNKKVKGGIRNQKRIYDKDTVMRYVARDFGLPAPKRSQPKGTYFNCLYKNTREFLRCEHPELGEKRYDNSVKALTDIWKVKCEKRVTNLKNNGSFQTDHLWYSDLMSLSWEETKEKYLDQLGKDR